MNLDEIYAKAEQIVQTTPADSVEHFRAVKTMELVMSYQQRVEGKAAPRETWFNFKCVCLPGGVVINVCLSGNSLIEVPCPVCKKTLYLDAAAPNHG